MLEKGINFLAGQQAKIRARLKRLMLIQVSAFSVLVIYAMAVVGLFGYYFWLNKENKDIQTKINRQKNNIQENTEIEMKQVFLKSKLSSLVPVFKAKQKHQQLTDAIFTLLPVGISISGFTIAESGDIAFSGEAADFSSLKNFLARLENKNLTPHVLIEFAEIRNIRIKAGGGYGFSITLKFIVKEELGT